ncbi:hypothetical protein OESDEN_19409 [Oesophagostomum dentatum]|uniref:Uncharacterized protein n=1 Tax=Oesophagostomum dentatum TaxID=61180 RepID=A0A0B1SAI6_OESDE|nr:hypothetical protein OESDEN_19409 [Oesophagostomum dentatum]
MFYFLWRFRVFDLFLFVNNVIKFHYPNDNIVCIFYVKKNSVIRNNEKLCTRNLNYLNVFFKNINFSNNSDPSCGACIGGHVSERYLREAVNCTSVYGDLIISNFRGVLHVFNVIVYYN